MNKEQEYGNLELDLNDFDKDTLIFLILYAHNNDITFNKAIEGVLKEFLSKYDV
jgi:hypothetical protein